MLRFPDGMRELLKAVAAANGRSMNAEIILRLQESIAQEDQAKLQTGQIAGLDDAINLATDLVRTLETARSKYRAEESAILDDLTHNERTGPAP